VCDIDWRLVLAFTKALAGPLATLVGAYVVSAMALRTFRGQKTIEKRVEWYERLYKQLDTLTAALTNLGAELEHSGTSRVAALQRAQEATGGMGTVCDEGFVYASRPVFKAIEEFFHALGIFNQAQSRGLTAEDVAALRASSINLSTVLSQDVRKDMGLQPL